VWLLVFTGSASAAACEGRSFTSCDEDADCRDDQRCDVSAGTTTARLLVPCAYVGCSTEPCSEGFVCADKPPGRTTCEAKVCLPWCNSDADCEAERTCMPSGLCELLACDEPGARACPDHWRCDPEAALTEPQFEITSLPVVANRSLTISRGCVRKRCNEVDGFPCLSDLWECTPERAEDATGCVPIPCEETGRCQNDDAAICMPTSDAPRGPGVDYHGCVTRTCEEGVECLGAPPDRSVVYCDPYGANPNPYGCVFARCDQGNTCLAGYVCDPGAPGGNDIGCVRDPNGATGGSGGTSGSGSSGTGTSGDTNQGGTAGTSGAENDPGPEGHCVDR
jgi:hypothetical protein